MGHFEELKRRTQIMIDEMEDDTEHSRSQSFLEEFRELRRELDDASSLNDGKEKEYSKLLDLLNRKGKENDMEPY